VSGPTPFSFPHRIGFGECDPARIFYAPRAIDWAAEAAEAWFEEVPGISWSELWARRGLEVRFESADCEYARSAVADQVVRLRVAASLAPDGALALGAVGEVVPGEPSFRARLELRLADPSRPGPVPIPEPWLGRIQAYQSRCGPPEALSPEREPAPPGRAAPAGPGPFRGRRRVRWADCGPSGSARAPRLADWAVEAAGEWYQRTLGISWREQCIRGRGAPFVRIRCDHLWPAAAGEELELAVRIPRLGRASIGYGVAGLDGSGRRCFEARMSACYISEEGGAPRATPFPEELRRRIEEYRAACGEGAV
jgi:acyl-CoA thioesterase FadM